MAVTHKRKQALFWVAGILAALALMNIAWAQIAAALTQCISPF